MPYGSKIIRKGTQLLRGSKPLKGANKIKGKVPKKPKKPDIKGRLPKLPKPIQDIKSKIKIPKPIKYLNWGAKLLPDIDYKKLENDVQQLKDVSKRFKTTGSGWVSWFQFIPTNWETLANLDVEDFELKDYLRGGLYISFKQKDTRQTAPENRTGRGGKKPVFIFDVSYKSVVSRMISIANNGGSGAGTYYLKNLQKIKNKYIGQNAEAEHYKELTEYRKLLKELDEAVEEAS